jgi:hypothetical protein
LKLNFGIWSVGDHFFPLGPAQCDDEMAASSQDSAVEAENKKRASF